MSKTPRNFFDPQGGPGGGLRGAAGGPNFRVYSSSITEESEMLWYWARGLKFWKSPTWDWKKYNERKILKKILKIFFFKFFFSDFFLWSPKVGFSGKGPPIDFLRIFFRIFFEKVPLGIEKKYNERKIWKKIFFFKIFFFRFFPLVPQGRFFQVRVPSMDFSSDFFFIKN